MGNLTVVTISTGDVSLWTQGAVSALLKADTLVLRTGRHAGVPWLAAHGVVFDTLDSLYETAEDFDTFNRDAAKRLWTLADQGNVTYAVSDPSIDATVSALRSHKSNHFTDSGFAIAEWRDRDHVAILDERRHAPSPGAKPKRQLLCQNCLHQLQQSRSR